MPPYITTSVSAGKTPALQHLDIAMFTSGKTSVRKSLTRHIARLMKDQLADRIDLDTSVESSTPVLLHPVQNVSVMQDKPEPWHASRKRFCASGEEATPTALFQRQHFCLDAKYFLCRKVCRECSSLSFVQISVAD